MTNKLPVVDFSDTAIAFHHLSEKQLKKTAWLFGMMNKSWLVSMGSKVGLKAVQWNLPFVESLIKKTIFEQFCGGETLLECETTIRHLEENNTYTILDYGAEGKETEQDFNRTMNETIRAIEFSAQQSGINVVSTKITGMARFELLEKIDAGETLNATETAEWENIKKRVDSICHIARDKGISIFIDAEESWIQDAIDSLVDEMMARYNREKVIVYNTFQLYRHDRLQFLKDSFQKAEKNGYRLGAKLVRGAYMDKERARAAEKGYPSPINQDKNATDKLFNEAITFCVDHYENMGSCCATHNAESSLLQAELIVQRNLPRKHPHLMFSQLKGMSDNITFNLAHAGFNVAKYVPYGAVREVIPYLIRRTQENTSITGDMSREYQQVMKEVNRRRMT